MTPLISIMMPCYNSATTLPLALASLIAQTYSNWECILVDDGSTDRPIDLIKSLNDKRIRYVRYEENKGRGMARQRALDLAEGDYLCALDADDWIYPQKLQCQLEVMTSTTDIAVLSTGMAIVNKHNDIVGVRGVQANQSGVALFPPLKEPKQLSIAHAPAMIRMDVAKRTKYDMKLRSAEDADYLIKILLHHPFGVLSRVTYAYSEIESVTLSKVIGTLRNMRNMFINYRHQYPRAACVNAGLLTLKEFYYRIGFASGLGGKLIERRSQKPNEDVIQDFYAARNFLYQVAPP